MGCCWCLGHGLVTAILLIVLSTKDGTATDKLRVAYQWKLLDYAWPDENTRELFPHYIRENNHPLGIEVAGDKLFITVPRWRLGVAATLNYINLNDTRDSPLLNPYPSWEAHRYGAEKLPDVISVYRIRADRCGRLWVLDTGLSNLLGQVKQQSPPTLIVYDLSNDQVLRKHVLPEEVPHGTYFTNVAVEDDSCEDSFAYLADSGSPAIVVYSWSRNDSWSITHHYFHPDPLGGNFNVSGFSFQWWDALIGLGLAPEGNGYSTLYFHPLSSTMEFSVSTRLLRDPKRALLASSFHEFKVLGSRGHNGQSTASFFNPTTGILFHAVSIGNYIGCWRPETKYTIENVGHVYENNVTLDLPSDIKIDRQDHIWVISDRLLIFMYGHLDPDDYNFRVLTGSAEEAVRGTVCSVETSSSSVAPMSETSIP